MLSASAKRAAAKTAGGGARTTTTTRRMMLSLLTTKDAALRGCGGSAAMINSNYCDPMANSHHLQQQNRSMAAAASAAKSRHKKRGLNVDQLKGTGAPATTKAAATDGGGSAAPTPSPPPTSASSTAAPVGGGGGGGGSSNLVAIGGAAAALAAGGTYLYYYKGGEAEDDKPPMKEPTTAAATPLTKEESKVKSVEKKVDDVTAKAEEEVVAHHRVTSIDVPSKMKNVAKSGEPSSPTAPILAHPPGGHRVRDIISKDSATAVVPEPPIDDDSSMTDRAVKALQEKTTQDAEDSVIESHQSFWSSPFKSKSNKKSSSSSSSSLIDLDHLDELSVSQLKTRIVQLATEMQDRTKWEAVRLKEFLAMKEKETSEKYMDIIQKQRHEFEDVLAKRLREQEHDLVQQTNAALQEKEASIQNVLNTALEAQNHEHEADKKAFEEGRTAQLSAEMEEKYGSKVEEYKKQVAADLQEKVVMLEALTAKLQHLENALSASQTSQKGSLRAHRLSAAALALSEKLETNKSATTELAALKAAAGEGGVIATALMTVPDDAVNVGVPTLSELQARFDEVSKRCRQAALVPKGRQGLGGQLAGKMFATLKYPPDPDDPAPENDKDNPEFVLVRARKHVQLGELEPAIEQLDKLQGQTAFTVNSWKNDAMNRIAVENALKVIKMECALINESFAS